MRTATGLSLSARPLSSRGFEYHVLSSCPTWMPELPPVILCVSEGLQATPLDTQGRFSPSAHSWRTWLFAWPSLPVCQGHV